MEATVPSQMCIAFCQCECEACTRVSSVPVFIEISVQHGTQREAILSFSKGSDQSKNSEYDEHVTEEKCRCNPVTLNIAFFVCLFVCMKLLEKCFPC